MKMKKIYSIVPNNRKTLFLRGIERILINHGNLHPECIGDFRKDQAHEIVDLLSCFETDIKENNITESKNKYEFDTLFDRFVDEQCRVKMPFNGR